MKKPDLTRRDFLVKTSAGIAAASVAPVAAAASPPAVGSRRGESSGAIGVAVFSCDITPPVGSPMMECHPPVATSIDIPLQAKGIILDDGRTRYAFCGLDYCELRTGAHDLVRHKLADALGVNELQIEVHCLHQHDAPLYDTSADRLLDLVPSPVHIGVPEFPGWFPTASPPRRATLKSNFNPVRRWAWVRPKWKNLPPTGASPCRTAASASASVTATIPY